MTIDYYGQQYIRNSLYGGGNPLDLVKLILLWVGWILVILFLVLVLVAFISAKNIKSTIDEMSKPAEGEETAEGASEEGTSGEGAAEGTGA